ncbi:hypothetical protein ILYODFUR_020048 [Ilyodon furcidens]|uniref:Uncharacterized protein n=1 Tax=Ilyodon furcidens TaxID=33524 RepID=A0ABV0UWC6_9TELE
MPVVSYPVMVGFLGTGMMVKRLKQEGTSHSSSDLLKISVKMGASWQSLRHYQTLSGPEAFLVFRRRNITSYSEILCAGRESEGRGCLVYGKTLCLNGMWRSWVEE